MLSIEGMFDSTVHLYMIKVVALHRSILKAVAEFKLKFI